MHITWVNHGITNIWGQQGGAGIEENWSFKPFICASIFIKAFHCKSESHVYNSSYQTKVGFHSKPFTQKHTSPKSTELCSPASLNMPHIFSRICITPIEGKTHIPKKGIYWNSASSWQTLLETLFDFRNSGKSTQLIYYWRKYTNFYSFMRRLGRM